MEIEFAAFEIFRTEKFRVVRQNSPSGKPAELSCFPKMATTTMLCTGARAVFCYVALFR